MTSDDKVEAETAVAVDPQAAGGGVVFDQETTMLLPTYRVCVLPPKYGSLNVGELYVEALPAEGGAPRLWIGCAKLSGVPGNVALMVPQPVPSGVVITITPIANPSVQNAVKIIATVTPPSVVGIAAMQGSEPNLTQVTAWAPWDAAATPLNTVWWLPVGDNYRIRIRVRSEPNNYVDSNLFAVVRSR